MNLNVENGKGQLCTKFLLLEFYSYNLVQLIGESCGFSRYTMCRHFF